jgi:hypothetical protein
MSVAEMEKEINPKIERLDEFRLKIGRTIY